MFQKPLPLGFECRAAFRVIIEWSVLKISARVTSHKDDSLTTEKTDSGRQCMTGLVLAPSISPDLWVEKFSNISQTEIFRGILNHF